MKGRNYKMEWLKTGWEFFQNQILGMHWINALVGSLLELVGLDPTSKVFGMLQFFIYDSIKILILLCVLIFIISYIQSFFPPEKTKRILGGIGGIKGRMLGAVFGILTPFCSCSSIPLFIGFTSAGLPIGVTLSFLIMSPMADLGSFTILMSMFGWKIAVAYLVTGFIIAVLGSTIIEKLGMEKHIEEFVKNVQHTEQEEAQLSIKDRLVFAKDGVADIVKRVWPYILIGVGIGSTIHNVIPESIVQGVLGGDRWYSVLLAALVGIPMYADIFGAIPIAEGLLFKGAGLGTVITFMMSVTALSFPSMVMLKKVMKPKLLGAFIVIVATGIIIIGYLFNAFSYLFI
jgi:uncharacterized membrane protein YraQ (UPF0718 family)